MTYFVDFGGYCEVTADSTEEAEEKFWEYIFNGELLPKATYECEGVEQKEEN